MGSEARNERVNEAQPRSAAAFTLIELVVSLAILGALVALAVPSYRSWIAEAQQRNAARALIEALHFARGEAIKRGVRVNLCKSMDGVACSISGGWESGWLMFADADRSGAIDGAEGVIVVERSAPTDITIIGNQPVDDYVSYTGLGTARMLNGALQMGTFTVCKPGLPALDVVLAHSGRARMQKTAAPCP